MKFASAQLEALEQVTKSLSKQPKHAKIAKQLGLLLEKLQKINTPKAKPKAGIGVDRAIAAMRSVLGDKLAVPRNPSDVWVICRARRIRDLGLTEDDCKTIARAIASKWDAPYSFEYCINAADRLLAEAETGVKRGKAARETVPVEMGDSWE